MRVNIATRSTKLWSACAAINSCNLGYNIGVNTGARPLLRAESLDYEDKKYICEFSDGEHGHKLFAWQHRYYGSDASVHLGSSRPGLLFGGSAILKTQKSIVPTKYDVAIEVDISVRLGKFLTVEKNPKSIEDDSESFNLRIKFIRDAYDKINEEVHEELKGLCASLCVLYSQKLIIHTMISWSNQFSLQYYLPALLETPCYCNMGGYCHSCGFHPVGKEHTSMTCGFKRREHDQDATWTNRGTNGSMFWPSPWRVRDDEKTHASYAGKSAPTN
jgi:hypothetical protein